MKRASAALLTLAVPAVALAADGSLPRPHGWVGTTNDWIQGLGIAFVLLNLVLLGLAWRSQRRAPGTPTTRAWALVAVGLVPVMVSFFTFAHGLETSATVAACGACHVMTPFVRDLQDVKSETLAATHYKNRYILDKQCYECHSDYGVTGTLGAKLEGLGHVWRYTTGTYARPIKIARPFPNVRCLECHGESQKFLNSAGHPKEVIPGLMANEMSCLDCHAPVHPAQTKAAVR